MASKVSGPLGPKTATIIESGFVLPESVSHHREDDVGVSLEVYHALKQMGEALAKAGAPLTSEIEIPTGFGATVYLGKGRKAYHEPSLDHGPGEDPQFWTESEPVEEAPRRFRNATGKLIGCLRGAFHKAPDDVIRNFLLGEPMYLSNFADILEGLHVGQAPDIDNGAERRHSFDKKMLERVALRLNEILSRNLLFQKKGDRAADVVPLHNHFEIDQVNIAVMYSESEESGCRLVLTISFVQGKSPSKENLEGVTFDWEDLG